MENSKFVDKFVLFAGKLGNQIHLKTLRDAFATVMPLYILAGLVVLLNNTVFKWIITDPATLSNVQYWGITVANGTLNISSLLIAVMVGYYLAQNREYENPLAASMISAVSLIAMMPNAVQVVANGAKDPVSVSGVLTFSNLGTGAMFAGVIVALLASELFIKITRVKALKIHLGDNVPPAVEKSFNVLVPVILVVAVFGLVSTLLFNIWGTNLITLITTFIQEPLRHVSTGLWGAIILYSLGNMLWLFGVHQAVIYSSILEPLLIINILENTAAYNAGEAIPHIINVSQVQTYALMGGSGSTICLLIATFLVSKNAASRNVAKLAFAPGLFNINEPVLFGYPIVYNVSMAIPFIGVPALGILISYIATSLGLMSPSVVQVPWTTPIFASSFLSTGGDWRAVVVQAIILVLGVLIYIPFIKVHDRVMENQYEG